MTVFVDKITDSTLADIEYTITASSTPTVLLYYDSVATAVKNSKNVSSVTDGGIGIFTTTYITAYANSDYVWIVYMRDADNGGDGYTSQNFPSDTKSTTQMLLEINSSSGGAHDTDEVTLKLFGDH